MPARASTRGKSTRTRAEWTLAQTTVTSVVPRARSNGTEREAFWAVIAAVGSATSSTSRLPGQAASICSASFRQPVNTTTVGRSSSARSAAWWSRRRHVGLIRPRLLCPGTTIAHFRATSIIRRSCQGMA